MDDLIKDGRDTTGMAYYKEKLFRKIDTGDSATVRSLSYTGSKTGSVITVGINEFSIREPDGEVATVLFEDILDIE